MSNFKQVTELRKSGELKKAFVLAESLLSEDSDNVWNKKAMAWVLFDYIKIQSEKGNDKAFLKVLSKISKLDLPSDQTMFFEQMAWQIGKYVFKIKQNYENNKSAVNYFLDKSFELFKEFSFPKPSEAYSFLFKAFQKGYKFWIANIPNKDQLPSYIEFADWWDFNNFRPQDFIREEVNQKPIMSIAEQAYIAYPKALLSVDEFSEELKEKIEFALHLLDKIQEKQANFTYINYFKAKLYLRLGQSENGLDRFLPFAQKRTQLYWIWDLLADFYKNTETEKACLAKALLCRTPEKFLVQVRLRFAELLSQDKKFESAKHEIQKVISTYRENGWKYPKKLTKLKNTDWYKENQVAKSNFLLYKSLETKADEAMYANVEEKNVRVSLVNTDRKVIYFFGDNIKGKFCYKPFFKRIEEGDQLAIRVQQKKADNYYRLYTARKV